MIFFKRFCVVFFFFPHCLIFHFGCYFDFIEKIKNNLTPIVQKCCEKISLIFTELWSCCPNSHLLLSCNFLLRTTVTRALYSVSDVHSARAAILLLIYTGWLCLGSGDLLCCVFTTPLSLWRQISPSSCLSPSAGC